MAYISHLIIVSSSFIKSWVVVGKNARIKTEAAASSINFDQKCKHCEKVISRVLNLDMKFHLVVEISQKWKCELWVPLGLDKL